MPIRLVCPSCSATLSVKDEYAGRAVKCPKCAGVIPASQPGAVAAPPPPSKPAAALPPPPPPAPEPPLFEELDGPAKPTGRVTGRPTGKPVAKAASDDLPDDDDPPARPAKRKGRDDDDRDDDRPARRGARGRGADDADDDRPSRGRRKRGDEDDDRPAKKKGGAGVIIGILCGTLLLCCGGVGYGGWWMYTKAKKAKDDFVEAIDKTNFRVNVFSYTDLEVGTTTRTEAEAAGKLGTGRVATDADLPKVFAAEPSPPEPWAAKVKAKRAVVWQNGDDYVIAAFHPTADGTARLQAKEWRPKSGAALKEGELDDAKFLQQYPPGGGPGIDVKAEDLTQAFKDNAAAADTKYKNKNVLVEGKLNDLSFGLDGEVQALLEGVPPAPGKILGTQVRVVVAKTDVNKVLNVSRGQTVKLKGRCSGAIGDLFVDVLSATFDSAVTDPNPSVTAVSLFNEYAKGSDATDEKYKDKPITLMNAVFDSKDGDASFFIVSAAKKGGAMPVKIKVTLPFDARKQIDKLNKGARVTVKGEYGGSFDNVISINRAWIAP